MVSYEIDKPFETRDQYLVWRTANGHVFELRYAEDLAEQIMASGFREPLTGWTAPPLGIARGPNLREGLQWQDVNSRMRASLSVIEEVAKSCRSTPFIYAAESQTSVARRLRNAFPCFIGSEYIADETKRDGSIRHEDLTKLSFPSATFDLVTTNEVLEHVPDIDASLHEMARVLKPGGWHVGTFPFTNIEESQVRSKLVNGTISYLLPPEYHGDPVTGGSNSLVFEVPGWNILKRAKTAGFSRTVVRMIASKQHGIVDDGGLVPVMCFQK